MEACGTCNQGPSSMNPYIRHFARVMYSRVQGLFYRYNRLRTSIYDIRL